MKNKHFSNKKKTKSNLHLQQQTQNTKTICT